MIAPTSPRAEMRFLLLVLFAGLVLRLTWLASFFGPLDGFYTAGEASNIARAVAAGRGIADAFPGDPGPTAHLLPINPAIAGFILWLLGPTHGITHVTLMAWSLAQTAAAYLLLRALFKALGSDPLVVRWGTALLCLVTPFVPQEVIDFRYWENGSALCLAALNLILIAKFERDGGFGWRAMIGIAFLSALTFFVSPPSGLAIDACWGWFALRRLPLARAAGFALLSALALAAFLVPWAVRNAHQLGAPILVRSNFGLELAVANHSAAVNTQDPASTFADRLIELHPYQKLGKGPSMLRKVGGEVPYSRKLGAETGRWIKAHPLDFARLTLRHLSEFFFPRPWQMYFTGWEGMRAPRAVVVSLVSLLGLAGLVAGLWHKRRGYAYLALYVAIAALPYAVLQPMSRYMYSVYGVLMFLAVDCAVRGWRYAAARGPGKPR